jgi:transposase
MSERAPALPPHELAHRLESTGMSARDVRAMFHDPDFQAIEDRNSQLLYLHEYALSECYVSINSKKLAEIYQISEGHVRRIRCAARKKEEKKPQPVGRPRKLSEDQEKEILDWILDLGSSLRYPTKREVLDEIENRYGKALSYGWLHDFLGRYREEVACTKVFPQEDPRLEVPRAFLEQYLALIHEHVLGLTPRLVYNIDETGSSDWEDRRTYEGIVPVALKHARVHSAVTRRVKHQTMLVCINAAGETLCPLVVTTDQSARNVFRDGIEEDVDLQVRVARSAYVDAIIFMDYTREILIPRIEDFRKANEIPGSPAILLMDNCSSHLAQTIIDLLSLHQIKVITFPPHTTGIFQMLDLVLFGAFKNYKSRLSKDPSLPVPADHVLRMFKALELAGASSTVRASFSRAGFVYDKAPDGTYILGFDERRIRESSEFQEVWKLNYPLERLSPRRRASRWGFLNSEAFIA